MLRSTHNWLVRIRLNVARRRRAKRVQVASPETRRPQTDAFTPGFLSSVSPPLQAGRSLRLSSRCVKDGAHPPPSVPNPPPPLSLHHHHPPRLISGPYHFSPPEGRTDKASSVQSSGSGPPPPCSSPLAHVHSGYLGGAGRVVEGVTSLHMPRLSLSLSATD